MSTEFVPPTVEQSPQGGGIFANSAECRLCGDQIVSEYRHDYRSCKCGEIFVDGGSVYLRRGAKTDLNNIIDRTIYRRPPVPEEPST